MNAIQWNLSYMDTLGPMKCVLIREVSFRGVPLWCGSYVELIGGKRYAPVPYAIRVSVMEPSFTATSLFSNSAVAGPV